jgi:hypothetical protein
VLVVSARVCQGKMAAVREMSITPAQTLAHAHVLRAVSLGATSSLCGNQQSRLGRIPVSAPSSRCAAPSITGEDYLTLLPIIMDYDAKVYLEIYLL